MLRVQFDFVVDTWSNPLDAGISDSRPSQKTRRTGRPLCGDVSEIKSLRHPPRALLPVPCLILKETGTDRSVYATRLRAIRKLGSGSV
jgi:hypothetical protein